MGAPIRQCSGRLHQEVGGCLEISSCGSTHQERHLRAARPVRRSGVSGLAAPGELPFLGSPAFPLYPSASGGGRQRVVGVAAACAGQYAGWGKRD